MNTRSSISVKILLLAFVNFLLLVVVFGIFARLQYRLDLSSFLLTPARDKILSVSRLIALELPETPPEAWSSLLARYSANYPARFYLFTNAGNQIGGDTVALPPALAAWVRGDHNEFFDRSAPKPDPQKLAFPPGPPILLLRYGNPRVYWVGTHIPIRNTAMPHPLHGSVVWRFPSLWTDPFFFNYKLWLAVLLAIIGVSVACWLPLIRGLTRSISQLTDATGRIAEGQFSVELRTKRRDELGQLSDSIGQMAAKLADLVNGQKRFLSDIAHELCSPIARIQMALGIVEQRSEPQLGPYIADLQEEVQHMSGLVNELLTFSKSQLGAERPPLEPVNVAETVMRVAQPESSNHVELRIDVDPEIYVDALPDYLQRSIANLVRNAVRYAGADGPVSIVARESDDMVSILVMDQGPGLPEEELDHVFRPFYRPEFARQRETGGVGLGLAIVKSCVEACDGRVMGRNRSPRGLEVEIRLHAAKMPKANQPEDKLVQSK